MKKLVALVVFLVLLLAGCRREAERAAVAQTAGSGTSASSSPASARADTPRPSVSLRRLWSGGAFNFYASSPSPDGRYVTEIDWATGDLAVRDLVTGQLHRLTDKGPWEDAADFAEVSRFSPDGQRIAFGWNLDATGTYQVRLVDFTVDDAGIPHGSEPVIVHPGGPQYIYWLYGWTSDDEILAGIYRPDNTTALAFLSLADGSLRVLKSFDWADAHAVLSPDGKLVAYDHPPAPENRERDIYLMASDGTGESVLIDSPGRDVVLGWTPDGAALLFHSDASGTPSVWRLPMSGDQAAGPAEIIQSDVRNLAPLGFAGGDYYFGSEVEAPSFHIARIDTEARRLIPTPLAVDEPRGWDEPRVMEWAPDGQHFIQDVPQGPTTTRWLLRRSDGSLVKQLALGFRLRRWLMRWMPDGRSLVVSGQDNRGRAGFFRVELATGEYDILRRFDAETGQLFALSPGGSTLYFTQPGPGQSDSGERSIDFVALDMASGQERTIHSVRHHTVHLGAGHSSPLAPTPDGQGLAFPDRGPDGGTLIQLLPLDGGSARTLHRLSLPGLELLGWSPDGAELYFLVHEPETADGDWSVMDVELWRVSNRGGDAERIDRIEGYVGGARLHPDGRMMAYRAGRYRGEIWALQVSEATTRTDPGVDR